MGLFFRRSTKIGPFRINVSNKGVGWSVGGKYLRYGKSATGKSYVSGGTHGIYYRQNLSNGTKKQVQHQPTQAQTISSENWSISLGILFWGLLACILSPFLGLLLWSWNVFYVLLGIGVVLVVLAIIVSSKCDKKQTHSSNNFNYSSSETQNTFINQDPTIPSAANYIVENLVGPDAKSVIEKYSEHIQSDDNEAKHEGCVRYKWNENDGMDFLLCLPDEWSSRALSGDDLYIPQQVWDEAQQKHKEQQVHDEQLAETTNNNNLGIEYERNGEIDKAIEVYEKNLQIGYKASYSYNRLLVIYRKLKRKEDEIRVAKIAIKMFPDDLSYQTRLNKLIGNEEKITLPVQAIVSHPRIIHGDLFENEILKVPEFDFYSCGYENTDYYRSYVTKEQLKPIHDITSYFGTLLDSAKTEDLHNNFAGSAAIYEQIVAEKYYATAPYDRLIKIYAKAKLKTDERRVLELAIDRFKTLKAKRKTYIESLALKYNAVDFCRERIDNNKSISYFNGAFVIYDPFNIIPKWEERLAKMKA